MDIINGAGPHAGTARTPAATTGAGAAAATMGEETAAATTAEVAAAPIAALLGATLGLAAGCWVIAVWQMNGMDMGVATRLGPFAFFVAVWVPMMAAMMLPGAVPTVLRRARDTCQLRAVSVFVGYYLAVWVIVGLAVYVLYRPHGTAAAGAVVIAAGAYELTPIKRHFRRRCREMPASGWRFGLCCVGSSIALMLMLVALGIMNVVWMAVLATLVIAQKLLPPQARVDVPVTLIILAFGCWILIAPASVPWLVPTM